jgi:hypothetical protein
MGTSHEFYHQRRFLIIACCWHAFISQFFISILDVLLFHQTLNMQLQGCDVK